MTRGMETEAQLQRDTMAIRPRGVVARKRPLIQKPKLTKDFQVHKIRCRMKATGMRNESC